jgi:hypothetical protein
MATVTLGVTSKQRSAGVRREVLGTSCGACVALALLAACAPRPATQLVVVIATDFEPGDELRSVFVTAQREGAEGPIFERWYVLGGLRYLIPGEIVVAARDPDDARRVSVQVTGDLGPTSVTQTAVVRFQRERTVYLQMSLTRACTRTTCAPPLTCRLGRCEVPAEARITATRPALEATPDAARSDVADGLDLPDAREPWEDVSPDRGADASEEAEPDTASEGGGDAGSEAAEESSGDAPDAEVDVVADRVTMDGDVESGAEGGALADGALDVAPEVPGLTDVPDPSVAAPRPLSPMSTSVVASQRPQLRWSLAADTDGARVELCRRRTCDVVDETIDVAGTAAAPARALAPGPHFWRLFGRRLGRVGTTPSPVWELFAGFRSGPRDVILRHVPDFNGDGLADVAAPVSGEGALSCPRGCVYVIAGARSGPTMPPLPQLLPPAGQLVDPANVAAAGDVNGDGFGDLLLLTRNTSGARESVLLYLGAEAGLVTTPAVALVDPTRDSWRSSGLGDLDGDGYGDVAVAHHRTAAVTVHRGGPSGSSASASVSLAIGARAWEPELCAVSQGGDFNGDGRPELVAGGYVLGEREAHVWVFPGSELGLRPSPSVTLDGPGDFGGNVTFGEFNGDGFGDLVVAFARRGYVTSGRGDGAAQVHLGGPAGISVAYHRFLSASMVADGFGSAMSAGDLDADGIEDLAVGVPAMALARRVELYRGGASGLPALASAVLPQPTTSEIGFGVETVVLGDVDGDGLSDLAIGAPGAGTGRVYLCPGARGALPSRVGTTFSAPPGVGYFGLSIAQ